MVFKDRAAFYRAKDELLKADSLYEDREFPMQQIDGLTWKRPTEFQMHPVATVHPIVLDVIKGNLEVSSFVAALSTICQRQELITKLFPDSQTFTTNYCGIFYFQFWKFGSWVIIDIDDRLPCTSGQLFSLRSSRQTEFFFCLLEKAYAKFRGGYLDLLGCRAGDVLVDLTGGVSDEWDLTTQTTDYWFPKLQKLADGAFPATAIMRKETSDRKENSVGLDTITTFSLKKVAVVDYEDNRMVRLIRLTDPWGTVRRYNGHWNDDAPEWHQVPQYVREKLVPKRTAETPCAEFWMTYADFMKSFSTIQLCILSPKDMGPVVSRVKWTVTSYKGEFPRFIPTVSNIRQTSSTIYEIYPQYLIELTDVDDYEFDGNCELLVSLMQKEMRDVNKMNMRFAIFPMKNTKESRPLKQEFFFKTAPVYQSPISTLREITARLRLNVGTYILVVLTTPNFKRREFLLRIYKHQRFNVWGHLLTYLTELDQNRKKMIPPSSRRAPIGPYDGPTKRSSNEALGDNNQR